MTSFWPARSVVTVWGRPSASKDISYETPSGICLSASSVTPGMLAACFLTISASCSLESLTS